MENAKDFTEVRSNDYRTKVKQLLRTKATQLLQKKGEAINYQLLTSIMVILSKKKNL